MSDLNKYSELSIDEIILLLEGKINYLENLVFRMDEKIAKLEEKLNEYISQAEKQVTEEAVEATEEVTEEEPIEATEEVAEEATEKEPIEATEETVEEATEESTEEPVAMGGSFGFGGNEPLDEEYAPVEKEPIVLENVPLGGSFGFESADTKVETLTNAVEEANNRKQGCTFAM